MRATTAYGRNAFPAYQNRPVAKARIGPHPNFSDVARGGQKTGGQKFFTARPGSRIAAPQLDIPEKRGVRFHTKQWVIGALAAITRIVANLGTLLWPIR